MWGSGVVKITVLGTFTVERADGSMVQDADWTSPRAAELLRFLATRHGNVLEPDEVASTLWGESGTQAAASLRDAVIHLHLTVGSVCVVAVETGMSLVDTWVDLFAYERRARAVKRHTRHRDFKAAVTAAQDSESLHLGELFAYEELAPWAVVERDRVRRLRSETLVLAAEAASSTDQHQLALDYAHRAVRVDMSTERAWRAVMRADVMLGRVGAARRAYDDSRHVIADAEPTERLASVISFPMRARVGA
ncbi:AfsR/SARP family transcriptional regulator [Nocardioides pacificus]